MSICLIAQTTIFLKKQFEHRRDRFTAVNLEEHQKTNFMNIQQWNLQLFTSPRMVFITIILIVMHIFSRHLKRKYHHVTGNFLVPEISLYVV